LTPAVKPGLDPELECKPKLPTHREFDFANSAGTSRVGLAMPSNNHYQTILQEIETDTVQKEIWLQAFAEAGGNHDKAVSRYVSMRGEQIYREETSFYRRSANSFLHVCDLRTQRGQIIAGVATLALLILLPLILQPLLNRSAAKEYQALCQKAHEKHVVGESARFLFQQLGEPRSSEINNDKLAYMLIFTTQVPFFALAAANMN
jgi:hypothetical protein